MAAELVAEELRDERDRPAPGAPCARRRVEPAREGALDTTEEPSESGAVRADASGVRGPGDEVGGQEIGGRQQEGGVDVDDVRIHVPKRSRRTDAPGDVLREGGQPVAAPHV